MYRTRIAGLFATLTVVAVNAALAAEIAERLTPAEVKATTSIEAGPGTSGVAGMRTHVLLGDPAKPGIYTIEIEVPPHTTIQAHHHRDDRAATVASGLWYIGYGPKRDETLLKELPAGSFYTEPGGMGHFAGTKEQSAVVRISGFGPSDTVYVAPAPASHAANVTNSGHDPIVLRQPVGRDPGKTLTALVDCAPGEASPSHRPAAACLPT